MSKHQCLKNDEVRMTKEEYRIQESGDRTEILRFAQDDPRGTLPQSFDLSLLKGISC
jgi:hypothetical protein